jgi:putative Holliday junction resolvase
MYILGIDYGTKKLGLAVADTESQIIMPLQPIVSTKNLFIDIEKVLKDYKPVLIVIGLPSRKTTAKRIQFFARELNKRFAVEIKFVNEDYSSKYADNVLSFLRDTGGINKKGIGKKDSVSATLILEEWFSTLDK